MESNQRKFIQYVTGFATDHAVHIWLGGSFLNGNATPYSDVDISVCCAPDQVKQLIYGYGQPVFLSHTTNPRGILVVIYEDGVAVDLEIVKGVSVSETEFFHREDIKNTDFRRNESAFRDVVLRNDEPYQVSRLFHRSLIKYLSGKVETGISVANEIAAYLREEKIPSREYYKSRINKMLDNYSEKHPMEKGYMRVLRKLLIDVGREK